MKELEVKILEINKNKIVETLKGLGAKNVFDGEIQTLFFDFKDGRIIKARDVLRLRIEQGTTELTYKKVHVTQTVKSAEEYSVQVSELETMKKILENIGLIVTEILQKHRTSFVLDHARFDIDRYSGGYAFIPEFLEIEAESTELIHKYAKTLGFEDEDCLPWSTDELINHYKPKEGKQ